MADSTQTKPWLQVGPTDLQGPERARLPPPVPDLFRAAPSSTGGNAGLCNGMLDFSLAEPAAVSAVVVSGATLHAQVWARDPAT